MSGHAWTPCIHLPNIKKENNRSKIHFIALLIFVHGCFFYVAL